MTERALEGGLANAGKVARDGPHVLRPTGPQTDSVHAFLRAVNEVGFDGAPRPIGVDRDGRERVTYIEGDVPLTPYPAWSQSDAALASTARLLRRLHTASRRFDHRGRIWNEMLADPEGGSVVCHNDVEPSNVVFRNGIGVALIDFEFAAPGRPVYDLAQLARLWVPIEHAVDRDRMGWQPADRPARLRLIADAYGLDRDRRGALLTTIEQAMDRVEAAARVGFGSGAGPATELLARTGGIEKYDRRRRWWLRHRHGFVAALR